MNVCFKYKKHTKVFCVYPRVYRKATIISLNKPTIITNTNVGRGLAIIETFINDKKDTGNYRGGSIKSQINKFKRYINKYY